MPEGRMRATPILLQHLIREKLVPLAKDGAVQFPSRRRLHPPTPIYWASPVEPGEKGSEADSSRALQARKSLSALEPSALRVEGEGAAGPKPALYR
jgi:hypothetical protein